MNSKSAASDDDVSLHSDWIHRLARQITRDPNEANDVSQATFLAALESSSDKKPRPWMARVARNVASKRRRTRSTLRDARDTHGDSASITTSHTELIEATEIQLKVRALVQGLSKGSRETLVAHFFDGESLAAIARRTGEPEGTIRWRKAKALGELRSRLESDGRKDGRDWLGALLLLQKGRIVRSGGHGTSVGAVGGVLVVLAVLGLALGARFLSWGGEGAVEESIASMEQIASPPAAISAPVSARPLGKEADELAAARPNKGGMEPEPALEPAPPKSLTVSVLSAGGSLVSGADVAVVNQSAQRRAGTTDHLGRTTVSFNDSDLSGAGFSSAAGSLTLEVSAPGFVTSSLHHFADEYWTEPRVAEVELQPGGGGVTGAVVDTTGNPMAGIQVLLRALELPQPRVAVEGVLVSNAYRAARTDAAGVFSLEGLPEGRAQALVIRGKAMIAASLVEISRGATTESVIEAARGQEVSGIVHDADGQPVPGAKVWVDPFRVIWPKNHESIPGYDPRWMWVVTRTVAGSDGSFHLRNVATGNARLWAQDPARPSFVDLLEIVSTDGDFRVWNPVVRTRSPLEFHVDANGVVPIAEARVVTAAKNRELPWVRLLAPDENGLVKVYDYPSGEELLDIKVVDPLGSKAPLLERPNLPWPSEPVQLTIEPFQSFRLAGRIQSARRQPLEDAQMFVINEATGLPARLVLDDEGRFAASLRAGRYTVDVYSDQLGVASFGSVDLTSGAQVDFDRVTAPLGRLTPEEWSGDLPKGTYHFLRAVPPTLKALGGSLTVSTGRGHLTGALDLLPGDYMYTLESADRAIYTVKFTLAEGEERQLKPGP